MLIGSSGWFLNLILGSLHLLTSLHLPIAFESLRVDIWLFQIGQLRCTNWFPLERMNRDCRAGAEK